MQLAARLVKVCAQQLVPVREALIWILLLVDATVRSAGWQPAEAVWQMTVTGRPGRAGGMAEQERGRMEHLRYGEMWAWGVCLGRLRGLRSPVHLGLKGIDHVVRASSIL